MKPIEELIEDIRRAGAGEEVSEGSSEEGSEAPSDGAAPVEADGVEALFGGELEDPGPAAGASPRTPRARRRRWRLAGRISLILLLVAALVGGIALVVMREERAPLPEGHGGAALADQRVVAWAVWDPSSSERAFAAIVAAGGGLEPLVLGVPGHTVASVPGYGLATVGDVAALQDSNLAAAALENLVGVQVDAVGGMGIQQLGGVVDALGGIEAESRMMDGEAMVRYLRRDVSDEEIAGDLRFVRWQEVLTGLLAAAERRPGGLEGLPPEVSGVLATGALAGADVVSLPVEDIGSGLVRPHTQQVRQLVADRFVPTSGGTDVRLVVLNGNGAPGIGERVARLLVPSGFRLVSSLNAPTFDEPKTMIVAASEEFLDEARLAGRLLGVGQVVIGEQPTGVADITVLVGADFGGS